MASYHLSAQVVKRSEGRSVVAMAAYRAGERLRDERSGNIADFSKRRGVVHAEIMAPEGSAPWLHQREALWNYVESIEKRCDAQLAREINMALPHELNKDQRLALVRTFVREQFVAKGMVADFAIHAPVAEKGDDPRNHHVHVLLTLRQAGPSGLRSVKTREWNSDSMLVAWRAAWADAQNRALGARGMTVRVDHRSLAVQKAEVQARGEPNRAIIYERVPELHVGPKVKKASLRKPPQSLDRKTARKRSINYTAFDQGSRGQHNINRLSRNASKFEGLAAKTQLRIARFQKRQAHYERQIRRHAPPQSASGALIPAVAASWTGDARGKYQHAVERRELVAWWLRELDQLFFELLGIRESQLLRRTVWSNRLQRWRSREDVVSDGRARLRV